MKIKGQAIAPGQSYVTPIMTFCIAAYFLLCTTVSIRELVHFWPSCFTPSMTSNNVNDLTVTAIYPAFGNAGDETLVSIRGTGFTDNMSVEFGKEHSKNVKIVDSTHLRVSAPKANKADKKKLVDIVVTNNPDGKPPGKTGVLANLRHLN